MADLLAGSDQCRQRGRRSWLLDPRAVVKILTLRLNGCSVVRDDKGEPPGAELLALGLTRYEVFADCGRWGVTGDGVRPGIGCLQWCISGGQATGRTTLAAIWRTMWRTGKKGQMGQERKHDQTNYIADFHLLAGTEFTSSQTHIIFCPLLLCSLRPRHLPSPTSPSFYLSSPSAF
ncbi:hypothetical protein BDQ17DRAFT_162824 [Cyathus striatus]|nr:hypothetical protein BDQ17DRAFT_162824 [Cyathus striatus]